MKFPIHKFPIHKVVAVVKEMIHALSKGIFVGSVGSYFNPPSLAVVNVPTYTYAKIMAQKEFGLQRGGGVADVDEEEISGGELVCMCSKHDDRCPRCKHGPVYSFQFQCPRCGTDFRWVKCSDICLICSLEEKLESIP